MIQCCKIVSAEGRDFICRNLQVKNLSFKIFEKTRPIGLDTVIQPQQPQQPQQLHLLKLHYQSSNLQPMYS